MGRRYPNGGFCQENPCAAAAASAALLGTRSRWVANSKYCALILVAIPDFFSKHSSSLLGTVCLVGLSSSMRNKTESPLNIDNIVESRILGRDLSSVCGWYGMRESLSCGVCRLKHGACSLGAWDGVRGQ